MDEMVDIVDEAGRVLHQAAKGDAHRHGWLHKTVIGYLKYGKDWALVRQADDRQDAGQLVAPVGGHVRAGESDLDALKREALEEIGVQNLTHRHVGTARFHRQVLGRDENHLFIVYEISTDDDILLGDEAVSIQRFGDKELAQVVAARPHEFGDAFYFVGEKFYPQHLPGGWIRRWD